MTKSVFRECKTISLDAVIRHGKWYLSCSFILLMWYSQPFMQEKIFSFTKSYLKLLEMAPQVGWYREDWSRGDWVPGREGSLHSTQGSYGPDPQNINYHQCGCSVWYELTGRGQWFFITIGFTFSFVNTEGHHNTCSFLRSLHSRDPIARPWGRDMGCLL